MSGRYPTNSRRFRTRTIIGLLVTAAWLAFAVWIAWHWQDTAADMRLNEWGDFFAGVVAPLAFLWLIIGYFQQGEELAQNTEALRAQVRETEALVQQYARQAEASARLVELSLAEQERADAERRAALKPSFRVRGARHDAGRMTAVRLQNVRGTALRLELERGDMIDGTIIPADGIEPDGVFEARVTHGQVTMSDRLRFAIRCSDVTGARHTYHYHAQGQ